MLLSIFTRAVGHRVEVSAPFFLLVAGKQRVADSAPLVSHLIRKISPLVYYIS